MRKPMSPELTPHNQPSPAPETTPAPAATEFEEIILEEIAIDGICGVY